MGSTLLDYADVTSRYLGQNQEVLRMCSFESSVLVRLGSFSFSIRQVPRSQFAYQPHRTVARRPQVYITLAGATRLSSTVRLVRTAALRRYGWPTRLYGCPEATTQLNEQTPIDPDS